MTLWTLQGRVEFKVYNSAEGDRHKARQDKMIQEKKNRDALQKRPSEKKARLSRIPPISVDELKDTV